MICIERSVLPNMPGRDILLPVQWYGDRKILLSIFTYHSMGLKIGIVGLPNVGKSTLFNALTRQNVLAANYPFATIDPNVGVVAVPDERLEKLAELEHSKKIVPTIIEFVDIAGLVAGASQGEGLGNKFLSHIREVDAIAEVIRVFEDAGVHHVSGSVQPARDMETIKTELILADLATLDKRLSTASAQAKSGDKSAASLLTELQRLQQELSSGKLANEVALEKETSEAVKELQLLTSKPFLYVENAVYDTGKKTYLGPTTNIENAIRLDAKLEQELSQLDESEKQEYLRELGIPQSGLDRLIVTAYRTLGLITFLTTGPDETRAWTVRAGACAPEAAGKIHTDFERGFIKAEIINWQKLLEAGSWAKARDRGWIRTEGRDYIMHDGDVVIFRFNV